MHIYSKGQEVQPQESERGIPGISMKFIIHTMQRLRMAPHGVSSVGNLAAEPPVTQVVPCSHSVIRETVFVSFYACLITYSVSCVFTVCSCRSYGHIDVDIGPSARHSVRHRIFQDVPRCSEFTILHDSSRFFTILYAQVSCKKEWNLWTARAADPWLCRSCSVMAVRCTFGAHGIVGRRGVA